MADLRISDEQRERAAREIRDHFAAGRLSQDELDERLQAAYSAKTESELESVRADLPKLPATKAEQRAELAARRSQLQRRLIQEAGGGVALFALCTGIYLASGASGQFWPIFVLLVVLIPLVRGAWHLYGPAPELDRVERELEQRAQERRRGPPRHGPPRGGPPFGPGRGGPPYGRDRHL
jgi:Domain of unknown function (DUF1707)